MLLFRSLRTRLCLLLIFFLPLTVAAKNYFLTAPDGTRLAVQESGDPQGTPIIFIHGLLGSHLNWEKQVQDVQLNHLRLITYDLRGHGISGKPEQESSYQNGKRWAEDLATVIEGSHAAKPLLVGWSLGGAVITHYLAAYGDGNIRGAMYVDGVVELVPEQIPAHPAVYRDMTAGDLRTHLDGERRFVQLCFHQQPDIRTFERLIASAAMASWSMQRAVQGMNIPLVQGLGSARVPLLFVYGKHDVLVNPQAALSRAQKVNTRIRSLIFADSGHAPFIEEPRRFNQELAKFVEATHH
ncbi:alpha/beta fold hydrolase [Lonsdalea quercina]|uniref:alpha/beta fold hydrolase n=1 Tax=Lonsdalea quercina TaxID=71657 RepID=UPI0039747313